MFVYSSFIFMFCFTLQMTMKRTKKTWYMLPLLERKNAFSLTAQFLIYWDQER